MKEKIIMGVVTKSCVSCEFFRGILGIALLEIKS